MTPYILRKHLTRKITFLEKNDPRIPAALFSAASETPDLSGFPYPFHRQRANTPARSRATIR